MIGTPLIECKYKTDLLVCASSCCTSSRLRLAAVPDVPGGEAGPLLDILAEISDRIIYYSGTFLYIATVFMHTKYKPEKIKGYQAAHWIMCLGEGR